MSASYTATFASIQNRDGVRLAWNQWPHVGLSSLQNLSGAQKAAQFLTGGDINSLMGAGTSLGSGGQRIPLPISALYCPAQNLDLSGRQNNSLNVGNSPQICSSPECRAILNPFCNINFDQKTWVCCFCKKNNLFQSSYDIFMNNKRKPPETEQFSTTVEYVTGVRERPPLFLFLVDVSVTDEELNSIKQNISIISNSIPKNSLVGIISFGAVVMLHELFEVHDFFKANVFSGSKKIDIKVVKDVVNRQVSNSRDQAKNSANDSLFNNLFFCEYNLCDLEFANIVDSLMSESKNTPKAIFEKRCTGVALDFAINLIMTLYPNHPAKLITFIGGPISFGPGTIISENNPEIRHFSNMNDFSSILNSSQKFFSELAQKAAKAKLSVDLYAGHADQVGLYELKHFPLLTNGTILLSDSFSSNAFRQSIIKLYSEVGPSPSFIYNGVLDVKTSRGLKVMGCIGPCNSMNVGQSKASKMVVGIGGTTRWNINSLDENTTLAFYFEGPSSIEDIKTISERRELGYIQFITGTVDTNNIKKLRVTTICRSWMDTTGGLRDICPGFDEIAGIILAARYAIYAFEFEDNPDCVQWLDKMLIALVKMFATYIPNDQSSLSLPKNFQMFPQFMYHFRRSNLITTFNISPDESTYVKNLFMKSSVSDSLIMLQPVLLSTSFNGTHAAILDAASIRPDNILILDTFFVILVYFGKQISAWIKNGYHRMPEYAHLNKLIDYSQQIAVEKVQRRKPTPRYVVTFDEGSQARFLYAKVNPSKSSEADNSTYILTDDVSLQAFLDSLRKLVVTEEVK